MKTSVKKTAGKSAARGRMTPAKPGAASGLEELFEHDLKDIYWAEKAILKALPKMMKNSTSDELKSAIADHISVTENQVIRLEKIFKLMEKKPTGKKCDGMEGLLKEGEKMLEETEPGAVRDAAIIASAQKVEHYEICAYGTMKALADTLGMNEAVDLLDETLNEEKDTDESLTIIAASINVEALEPVE